ncbi:MAG TPA: hypothetical protein VJS44_16510 [Pyrinomonadaceae bacterium]|nr:hypothetical protein [Pyrinomonadaceae bacterium]
MNTQTESKQDITQSVLHSDSDQITPIIIKTGGGGGDADGVTNQVSIQSFMKFESSLENTWEVARSADSGRITEVSVKDGDQKIEDLPIEPNLDPTSVTIYFGQDTMLMLGEEEILNSTQARIVIESNQVPFQITTRKGLVGWVDSTASFSEQVTSVVIMQGETQLSSYTSTNPDFLVSVIFTRADL